MRTWLLTLAPSLTLWAVSPQEIHQLKEEITTLTSSLENLEQEKIVTQQQLDTLEIELNKPHWFPDPDLAEKKETFVLTLENLTNVKIPEISLALNNAHLTLQELLSQLNPPLISLTDPLPLTNWLHATQIASFFQPLFHTMTNKEEHFNAISSLNQYYLALEPYGFSSNFSLNGTSFEQKSAGISLQGGLYLQERWVIGAGVGYGHSNFSYTPYFHETSLNTFFAGPFAAYLGEKGFIELRLLGLYNSYDISEESLDGWNLDTQLEGALDFETEKLLGPRFFLTPNFKLDYFVVFQNTPKEKLYPVRVTQAQFFSSRLALQLLKEFPRGKYGFLLPSLNIGWMWMKPLSKSVECESGYRSVKYPVANQFYLGAYLSAIHTKGIEISLGFDGYFSNLYPSYAGHLKIGLEW